MDYQKLYIVRDQGCQDIFSYQGVTTAKLFFKQKIAIVTIVMTTTVKKNKRGGK